MRSTTLIAMFCFVIGLQLALADGQAKVDVVRCDTLAKIAVPKYRIGQNIGGKTTSDGFILIVSVNPSEASKEKLMALSCKLSSTYAAFDDFYLMVSDEYLAAAAYNPGGVDVPYEGASSKLRATYESKKADDTRDFMWFPIGGERDSAQAFNLIPST